MLAGLRGDRTVKEVCREHEISETLYYGWRDQLLEGGPRGAGRQGRAQRREGAAAEDPPSWSGRWAGRRTSWRSRGSIAGLGVSERVARSRELVAEGYAAGGGGACAAGQPAGDLPDADAEDGAAAAAAGRSGRAGDRRGRRSRTRPTATGW